MGRKRPAPPSPGKLRESKNQRVSPFATTAGWVVAELLPSAAIVEGFGAHGSTVAREDERGQTGLFATVGAPAGACVVREQPIIWYPDAAVAHT
jgi:hypothetical protein